MQDATPLDPAFAAAGWLAAFWQVWLGRAFGPAAVERARRERLRDLVAFARRNAPFYRELYAALPPNVDDCAALPVTTKTALMSRFDDWVTDRAVTRAAVERFLADRARVGERFLRDYVVWKSSGTSGDAGIFVQDRHALSIYDGLLAVQLAAPDLAARCVTGSLRGGRAALIAATGDHFASIASWERVCRASPAMNARGFSVLEPVDALVEKLNAFDPTYLASYPTVLALLAEERRAGRLAIEPALAWSGGEYLSPAMHEDIERAFGCRLMNEYGASEFLSIGYGCAERWIHVNDDWVIVEPVDRDHRPTPPGSARRSTRQTRSS